MAHKTITLITGANTGIGLAVATALARDHGHHVIIGSRNASAGAVAAATLTAAGHSASSAQLDVTSDASIAAAVAHIASEFGVLDVLVNNAGILLDMGANAAAEPLTPRELFRRTFETNVFGVEVLTRECEGLLRKAEFPRVIFVSSAMGSVTWSLDKNMPWYGYECRAYDSSKAALNMLTSQWNRVLEGTGAAVNVVCPGLVKSGASGYHPDGTSTEVGAERIVELATAEKGSATGTYSNKQGPIPW